MEDGSLLRFRMYKVLNGPVQQSFVYTFHQTYTQDTNVHSYMVNQGLTGYFTEVDLASLQLEKRPARHRLPLLFKVLKTCCTPSLAPPTSPLWKNGIDSNDILETKHLETLLVTLAHMYEELSSVREPIAVDEFENKISFIKGCLEKLIEMAGKFDVTGRWREDLERIMGSLQAVTIGQQTKQAPMEEISEDIKVELEMQYQAYKSPVLNPMLLNVTQAVEIPSKRTRKNSSPVVGEKVTMKDILAPFKRENTQEDKTRICLIRADPGCGRSSLAELLALSWKHKDDRISHVGKYDAVILISAATSNTSEKALVEIALPLSSLTHGMSVIKTCINKLSILLIIDDAEELNIQRLEELKDIIEQGSCINAVILTVGESYDSIQEQCGSLIACNLHLNGYDREEIVSLSEALFHQKSRSGDSKEFKKYLVRHMCRLCHVLKHPVTLVQFCEAWIFHSYVFDNVSTVSDLLWTLTIWKFSNVIEINFEDNYKETKEHQWLMAAGCAALSAFKDNRRLEGSYMLQLQEETSKIYPKEVNQRLLNGIFTRRNHHVNNHVKVEFCSVHNLQQEFLTAWYVAHMILKGKKFHSLTGNKVCLYQLSLFIGGHISRMNKGPKCLPELEERRLISAIVNHSEDSYENLIFNFDLVTEIKAAPRLIEYIVEVSEYPEEWNLSAADIQVLPLETLLMHVSPIRLFMNVEKLKPYSELTKVLTFMCRVDIFVWLDSNMQFVYGNKSSMDRIVKAFFKETVMTKIDLISGFISNEILHDVANRVATKHLAYLKLRVQDFKTLSTVLVINKYLPKLLWLEVKIDYPILEEDITGLPLTTAPLFDVYLQNIDDKSVSLLVNLLGSMHTRYTGIHLENTSLTPEGLFVFLKQLQKRNICLYSDPVARDRFRRWYYPQLANINESEILSDETVEDVLGFDDRKYYSNHFVGSSCFALALDAWNLMSYLEEQEEILHFTFNTENLSFIKRLTGSVDIVKHET